MTIRSFRVAFDLERRLFKIDKWRVPLAYGLPLRSLGYAAAAFVGLLMLSRLPLVGLAIEALPPPIRFVILPGGIAYGMTQIKVDGRSAHKAASACVSVWISPSRLVAFRRAQSRAEARFGSVTFVPDEGGSKYRPGLVTGPCRITLRYPARAEQRGATLTLSQKPGRWMRRGKTIDVQAGQRVVFK